MIDYEKAYKEALERAKEIKSKILYSHLSTESCKAVSEYIDKIIPELAESEDERIRKVLVDMVKRETGFAGFPSQGQVLAYLEKQKDASKAIEAVDRIDKYIDEHLANAHDMKDSNPDKKYYRGLDDALGKMAGILQDVYSLEKQKEQPKEELVYRLNGLMQDYIKEGKDDEEKEHRFKCYQLFWDALENTSYFEQKEQKPTPDWMPKFLDELRAKKHYFDWDEHRDIEGHILAIINWIAPDYFDRKEKEQKPAEWSEADEWMLNVAIKSCEQTIEDYPNDKVRFKDCIVWLKSLRSPKSSDNWKPSEEQPNLPGIEENGIPGKDFIPVEWVDACEKYGKWKIVKVEQQEVDLEEEIDKVIADYSFTKTIDSGGFKTTVLDYEKIAHHFAEWQKAKMMEGAVEGTVIELGETYKDLSLSVNAKELNQVLQPLGVGDGNKVKIIIVKEEEE